MFKLKPLFLVLMLIGLPMKESVSEDQLRLDVGDRVDVCFDKQTSQKISALLGEHPDAFGTLVVTGRVERYEDGAFVAIGEFGIGSKDKQSLVRIKIPFELSQCQPIPERLRHRVGSEFSSAVLHNPSLKVGSTKGIKIARWELASEIVLAGE